MTTTFASSVFDELGQLVTPEFSTDMWSFEDADEELIPIAQYIRDRTPHNDQIEPDRIKFLYMRKPKKVGGRYSIGDVILRSEMEKMVNNDYDYIVTIYHPVWKDLDNENKVIQLDKVLCGVDMGTLERPAVKKKQADSREHVDNLNHFGPDKVLRSSETIHLATERIIEEEKEARRDN